MFKKKSILEKEWTAFLKREEKAVKRYGKAKEPFWEKRLQGLAPEMLREKLEAAFYQAFWAILQNGTGVIEKTYSREKLEADFKIREYSQTIYSSKKNLTANARAARAQAVKSIAGTGAEGAVLGFLGIGLPDIPLFMAAVFRSLYTLCLHYGIDYEKKEEQELLLELLALSLYCGEAFREKDAKINKKLYRMAMEERADSHSGIAESQKAGTNGGAAVEINKDLVKQAAKAMSGELLYLKFLQGIPIAGVIGGIYDGIYLKKITGYVSLKLERRYLLSKLHGE